ncbi:MAG TPA: alpha-amylase/4-alpha-glucanotransferase domain-containing protein [Gemmatimonadaceae bacterium]|nr:alpha-amylase/4-alpha-glucanotransferase domain-containing protein [Gemmatimonadaceae bacterium]
MTAGTAGMTTGVTTSSAIRFCMGVHLHQPVGNFDSVFEQHMTDVYLPFLTRAREAGFLPLTLHVSVPLIEWMEAHDKRYLDLVGELASAGQLELLLAGFYEPVLVALPREDRLEQIQRMRETLHARFGVDARGLWLTERVWESELAADLHDAGVRYALVDDRHFLVSGVSRDRLHAPFWTEAAGKRVALFPIDERLRYLIPFQPPEDTVGYLRALRAGGQRLAVLADDGEKFGGWPGTFDWVYTRGWLTRFFDALRPPIEAGEVRLSTFADALDNVPSGGLAYLGTSSYREMEAWSLPLDAASRLERLEQELGADRIAGPDGTLVRGAHWRNFMVKYAEANRMHKKMVVLSRRCHAVGDPWDARVAIARAQCNDAYWHGVFGGLYLPHLRDAVWRNLAAAERVLRHGERLGCQIIDIDADGHPEVWVHSAEFSAVVSPYRGGAVEEWTHFASGLNAANTLTRRRELYHRLPEQTPEHEQRTDDSAPSIHDLEHGVRLDALPPVDLDVRALLQDRLVSGVTSDAAVTSARYDPLLSWATAPLAFTVEQGASSVTIEMRDPASSFGKSVTFLDDGSIDVRWKWHIDALPEGALFMTELSVACPVMISAPDATRAFRYEIETVAMSERGLDRTRQGTAEVRCWPALRGAARLTVRHG